MVGCLANPLLSIFMSFLIDPTVSPRHRPHTCCCRLLRFRCTSQCSGVPGSVHAMDTSTHCDPAMESETQGHTNDCRNWYLELCCAVAWKNDVVLQHVFRTCHIVSSRRWTAPKKNHDGCMLTMLQRKNIFWELSGWTECRSLYEYVWTWTFLHPKTFN